MSYAKKTIFSSVWSASLGFINQVCSLAVFVVLSRYLTIEEFGLVALCFLLTEMLVSLSSFGVNQLLIQRPYWSDRFASSCFKLVILLSLAFALLMVAVIAPLTEAFFFEDSFYLLCLLSTVPLISSFSTVCISRLLREFENKTITLVNAGSTITSSLLTIVLIYCGLGVWAVVIGRVIQSFLSTCSFQVVKPFWPKHKFSNVHKKRILSFGIPVFGQVFLTFVSSRIVNFVSLFLLGSASFAFVSVAQRAIRLATEITVTPLNGVLLQSFSRVNDDSKIEASYFRIIKVATFIIYPMFVGLSIVSSEFVLILFGEKWLESSYLLSILCYSVILSLPAWFLPTILVAKAKTNLVLKLNIVGTLIALVTTTLGALHSMTGLVVGAVFSAALVVGFKITIIRTVVHMRYSKLVTNCIPAIIASFAMVVVSKLVDLESIFSDQIYNLLAMKIILGVITYIVSSLLLFKRNTLEVISEFNNVLKK